MKIEKKERLFTKLKERLPKKKSINQKIEKKSDKQVVISYEWWSRLNMIYARTGELKKRLIERALSNTYTIKDWSEDDK